MTIQEAFGKLSLGRRVKVARTIRGWSQAQLSVVSKVEQIEVSYLERDLKVPNDVKKRILQTLELNEEEVQKIGTAC